ncbi:MAG: polyamine aminopropyltransferase [Spirochaetota bacterium]|nr:polyamine aminopropyltransferase [Spirochaetota bacterium]
MPVESLLWFEEKLEYELGRTIKIKINKLIEQYDSKFQRIEIYETKPFGRMLVLDGIIMCTEWDEFTYHEMITHVPMFTHPMPENILVIGGGDGGTIREVLKHPEVKKIDLCEIDEHVIRLSKQHLQTMSSSFEDNRVSIFNEDGAEFIKKRKNCYDIIIVDSSDPIGAAEELFKENFYSSLNDSLKNNGIAVTQSESFFYDDDLIKDLTGFAKKYFTYPAYFFTLVPTYPSGIIGFTFCSKAYHHTNDLNIDRISQIQPSLKYYNPDIHKASFALPNFIKNKTNL